MEPRKAGIGVAVALLVVASAAAGTLVTAALLDGPADGLDPAELVLPGLVAHQAAGLVEVPLDARGLSTLLLPIGRAGAEPTVGATSDGRLFVTGMTASPEARMWRSLDAGGTWRDVAFPAPRLDFDPFLWVDPDTDRVFSVPLYMECSNLMWSDDGGDTWAFTPTSAAAGCPYADHDHQSLTTGAPRGVATRGYPNVVYYAYQSASAAMPGTFVSRSLDGGATWATGGTRVFEADCQGGLAGVPVAAPDGTLYLPKPGCDGIRIAVSRDSGATWNASEIVAAGIHGGTNATVDRTLETAPLTPNPAIAVDEAGVAYVVWTGADSLVRIAHSRDMGRTWSEPVLATPPGVTATAFTASVAGSAGRVAIAYLGTTDDVGDWRGPGAHFANADTRWDLYVADVRNASSTDPLFTTVRVTPDDDPVQIGCIWQAGGATAPCRNLRDYLSMTIVDGRPIVAFADGCRQCATQEESTRADAHLAVVATGPGLLDGLSFARWP